MDTLEGFLGTVVIEIGSAQIIWAQLLGLPCLALVGIFFIRWSTRLLHRRLEQGDIGADLVQMITRAWLVVAAISLALLVLRLLEVPLTAFAFVSGAIAIGVGFGAQNIINNFISGWILMWERAIRIGDFLEIGTMLGTVEVVNTRFTRIRRVDGVHILLPNSKLLESEVVNWTLIDGVTRTTVRVGVTYGSPVEKVSALMSEVAKNNSSVLSEPAPVVFFEDFGDNALIFELYVWADVTREGGLRLVRSDLRYGIAREFEKNDIAVAFPQRDIHVDGELLVRRSAVMPGGSE